MLVLTRHRDEVICIGDDVKITVVDLRGDKVRLGIDAPASVPVHRLEVYDAIQKQNKTTAAAAVPPALPPATNIPNSDVVGS